MSNLRKCRCGQIIPSKRNYCDACYLEVLQNYQEKSKEYERAMETWNSMSIDQQAAAHRSEESFQLQVWTIGFFLIAAAGFGYWLNSWTVAISIGIIGIIINMAFSYIVGRVFRGIVMGALFGAVGAFVTFIIDNVSEFGWFDNFSWVNSQVAIIIIGIAFIVGIVCEIKGVFHASATPIKPTLPHS
ncbi:MAG: hypothetical protein FWE23_11265 [Chitinivibrionia bacterium]|nr:hypothetical protein [Chitinivibrionia bacterium]